jgi:hypothetical protein
MNCVPQQRLEKWHMAIIRELGYRKVCTRWVPKMPTSNTSLKQHLYRILQCNEKHGDASLSRIIIGDKAQVQPYNPLTKRQSMEWHHQSSLYKKKNSRYRLLWLK